MHVNVAGHTCLYTTIYGHKPWLKDVQEIVVEVLCHRGIKIVKIKKQEARGGASLRLQVSADHLFRSLVHVKLSLGRVLK